MMSDKTDEALYLMVADAFKASGAPRFLIHLFTLPAGEYRLKIEMEHVGADGSEAWLMVSPSSEEPRRRLSFCSEFPEANQAGVVMPSVWTHILVSAGKFHEAKSLEETLPEKFEFETDLQSLAAGGTAVEDLCDACALPVDPSIAGTAPPDVLESGAPFIAT